MDGKYYCNGGIIDLSARDVKTICKKTNMAPASMTKAIILRYINSHKLDYASFALMGTEMDAVEHYGWNELTRAQQVIEATHHPGLKLYIRPEDDPNEDGISFVASSLSFPSPSGLAEDTVSLDDSLGAGSSLAVKRALDKLRQEEAQRSQLAAQKGLMEDVAKLISDAIAAITTLSLSADFFSYNGFDPEKCQAAFIKKGREANPSQYIITGNQHSFHGSHIHNDVAFLVGLALCRGNNTKNMLLKSNPEMVAILKDMISTYGIMSNKPTTGTSVTLMRIVACFPRVAFQALLSGIGRNMVPEYAPDLVMSHLISFQMVKAESFHVYAPHFLVLSQKIDAIINQRESKRTDPRNLWNYMVVAYNSKLIPDATRLKDIGTPSVNDLATFECSHELKAIMIAKIASNKATTI